MNIAHLAALVSALHMLGLAIALGSLYARGRAFQRRDLAGALVADNWWGVSAVVMIGTGLVRAFGPTDKGSDYYLDHTMFHLKLGLVGLLMLLELRTMVVLVVCRIQQARGQEPDPAGLDRFVWPNRVQLLILVGLPFVAAAMARGLFY